LIITFETKTLAKKFKAKNGLLGIDDKMRVCLAMTKPYFNLNLICFLKQAHPSHCI